LFNKYQTIAKPPVAPTVSNVTVPHWWDGDPVALAALGVSAGVLLAVVAGETLSNPRSAPAKSKPSEFLRLALFRKSKTTQ
jgi:hypothetical protein